MRHPQAKAASVRQAGRLRDTQAAPSRWRDKPAQSLQVNLAGKALFADVYGSIASGWSAIRKLEHGPIRCQPPAKSR